MIDEGKRSVLGVLVDVVDYEAATAKVVSAAVDGRPLAVTALAVHGVMTGVRRRVHGARLNGFDLVTPDGQPVRWALNLLHDAHLDDRVYGPALTRRVLTECARKGLPVYFYGSTVEILEHLVARLHERLPDLRIVGVLGTSLVICGVVLVAWKLRSGRTFLWLVRRQLDAFALIAIVYALVPTHRLSAGVNVARVQRGEYRPILHSFRQSHETESAAVYLALLDHPDVRVRQGVAALLLEQRDHLRAVAEARRSWREGDIVTGHTLAALEGATPRLESALGSVAPLEAKRVLLEISRAANEDRSIEDMLAISAAQSRSDFVH